MIMMAESSTTEVEHTPHQQAEALGSIWHGSWYTKAYTPHAGCNTLVTLEYS